ncbi:hypothetical protein GBF35_25260 [Nonomuraea phyllanthi]|uniref:hypothetical protein n=1 Tax=Nonomuraea phyllanthi TaxID=2219224 RepID=UPI001293F994|nr:hypothetical protein [Nonomuraea phyllanthi]QFY09513.1 hypothetical protein GBF35_25260 [Nonomuraea phyllanthi]
MSLTGLPDSVEAYVLGGTYPAAEPEQIRECVTDLDSIADRIQDIREHDAAMIDALLRDSLWFGKAKDEFTWLWIQMAGGVTSAESGRASADPELPRSVPELLATIEQAVRQNAMSTDGYRQEIDLGRRETIIAGVMLAAILAALLVWATVIICTSGGFGAGVKVVLRRLQTKYIEHTRMVLLALKGDRVQRIRLLGTAAGMGMIFGAAPPVLAHIWAMAEGKRSWSDWEFCRILQQAGYGALAGLLFPLTEAGLARFVPGLTSKIPMWLGTMLTAGVGGGAVGGLQGAITGDWSHFLQTITSSAAGGLGPVPGGPHASSLAAVPSEAHVMGLSAHLPDSGVQVGREIADRLGWTHVPDATLKGLARLSEITEVDHAGWPTDPPLGDLRRHFGDVRGLADAIAYAGDRGDGTVLSASSPRELADALVPYANDRSIPITGQSLARGHGFHVDGNQAVTLGHVADMMPHLLDPTIRADTPPRITEFMTKHGMSEHDFVKTVADVAGRRWLDVRFPEKLVADLTRTLVERDFPPEYRILDMPMAPGARDASGYVTQHTVSQIATNPITHFPPGVLPEGHGPGGTTAAQWALHGLQDQARQTAGFFHLRGVDSHEQMLIHAELTRLGSLVAEHDGTSLTGWPAGRDFYHRLTEISEDITGSPDPYHLVKRYRLAYTDNGIVRSLDELRNYDPSETSWAAFDVGEYIERNYYGERVDGQWNANGDWAPPTYRKRIFGHDINIINGIYKALARLGIQPGTLRNAGDIGGSGNMYPTQVLHTLLVPEGTVNRVVYTKEELRFNQAFLGEGNGHYHYTDRNFVAHEFPTRAPWPAFSEVIQDAGAQHFPGQAEAFRDTHVRAQTNSTVERGSVFNLPRQMWDATGEFFVIDSIVKNPDLALQLRNNMIEATKDGGVVLFGLVINKPGDDSGGGQSYTAGEGTKFPNLAYARESLERFLADHPRVERWEIIESRDDAQGAEQFSAGEEGLAVAVVKLKDAP